MARHLMEHQTLLGKTSAEIIGMLGQPDRHADRVLLYDLGPERGSMFRIDNDWLDIRFTDPVQQVATKVLIRPD